MAARSQEGNSDGNGLLEDKLSLELLTRNYEFEHGLPLTGVEGRLARCQNFWFTKLNCPLFVKCVLRYGYTLPLKAFPATTLFSNNRSALRNSDFVQDAIEKILKNRCIVETVFPPHVVNPLSLSEGKKLRLVLDLRYVNQFLQKQSFRYEDLKTLQSEVFQQDYYFFTFDLESQWLSPRQYKRKSPTAAWFQLDFSKWKENFFMFFVSCVSAYRRLVICLPNN